MQSTRIGPLKRLVNRAGGYLHLVGDEEVGSYVVQPVSELETSVRTPPDILQSINVDSGRLLDARRNPIDVGRITNALHSIPSTGEVGDLVSPLHDEHFLFEANVSDECIRHEITSGSYEPAEEGGEEVVHQVEHDEAYEAEDEHADTAYDYRLLELQLGGLPSHLEDFRPRPPAATANPRFEAILPALHTLLDGALGLTLFGHGDTSGVLRRPDLSL